MPLKSYLIAPEASGLVRDLEPWLIPEDAFATLEDAYTWRGRVRKRWGTELVGSNALNSRLRIALTPQTDPSGDISVTVPGAIWKVGQNFSIASELFTVNASGAPANMLTTGSATVATFDTTNGALVINGAAPNTTVYFYPAEPVMGLPLRENSTLNFDLTIAFDTQFSYERVAGAWEQLDAATVWSGSNSDFFWATNYRGASPYDTAIYVTNNVAYDGTSNGIRWLLTPGTAWTLLRPQLDTGAGTRYLEGCRLVIGFKDRLLALNTLEGDYTGTVNTFGNRVRWSLNGNPTANATSWIDDVPGSGGYLDAPTKEEIITAELLKDHLVVYFEKSTWELVYTADTQLPFKWQQINNELGAESTFSIVGFDTVALGVGNVGIHACDTTSVQRIDQLIPDEVFQIHNGNDGPERVYGVRDYYREMVYWTFPDSASDPTYPTRVLVYNYATKSWAIFKDSFTCFGYLQYSDDLTWAELGERYGTWANWNDPWGSGSIQSQFPWIVAGNQEGWTFLVDTDNSSNAPSLSITDMSSNQLVVVDHNLMAGYYVRVEDAEGITALNDQIFRINTVVDADTIELDTVFTGTYTGNGKLRLISGLDVRSKQWNPGTPVGQQFRIPYMDFLLDRTDLGEISIQYYADFDDSDSIQSVAAAGVLLGSDVVATYPEDGLGEAGSGERLWHRYFLSSQGQTLQIQIFLSDAQLRDFDIATSKFQLNATLLYAEPSGRIVG